MAAAAESTAEAGATTAEATANQNSNKGSKKDHYGYLFEGNKTPTKTLDALLRAIAKHIVRCIIPLLWVCAVTKMRH